MDKKWFVCRICLRNDKKMQKIFDVAAYDLIEQIEECGGIKLINNKNMPDEICSKCLLLLKAALKFRSLCQRTERLLLPVVEVEVEESHMIVFKNGDSFYNATNAPEETITDTKNEVEEEQSHEEYDEYLIEDVESPAASVIDDDTAFIQIADNDDGDFIENDAAAADEIATSSGITLSHELSPTNSQFIYNEEEAEAKELQIIYNNAIESKVKIIATQRKGKKPNIYSVVTEDDGEPPRRKRKAKADNGEEDEQNTSFICCHCGNMYNEKAKLTVHMKTHAKEKPHQCEICKKRFAQTPQLARHMNSHTGNRPYKCKYCDSSFADPSTCVKHQRIHTNERPYACDVCGKAFAYTNVLKVHLMTHTGDKPFACAHCGKKFTQLHHKKSHERIHRSDVSME